MREKLAQVKVRRKGTHRRIRIHEKITPKNNRSRHNGHKRSKAASGLQDTEKAKG